MSPWQEQRAKVIMLEQMSCTLSIADIARACALSRSHFSRSFKRVTGFAPREWLLQARIERAKALLTQGQLPLSQIGLECGFTDQPHLTRVFTRLTGLSPRRWLAVRSDKKRAAPCQGDGPKKPVFAGDQRAVITDSLVIPARSMDAIARATSP